VSEQPVAIRSACASCGYEPVGLKPSGWLCGICSARRKRDVRAMLRAEQEMARKEMARTRAIVEQW
jgi:hypothetical protein